MPTITLIPEENKRKDYKIRIGKGIIKQIPKYLKKLHYSKYVIVTDMTVRKLYGIKLQKALIENDLDVELLSFLSGEKSKNLKTIETLLDKMLGLGCDRNTCILALGGGVVGDIAGFLASTFMRGINFIQIPTTLLSMADSSIGGKTGVNTKSGKNLIGAFHQPVTVFVDIETLSTLPENELKNGYAEIIKMATIRNKSLFKFLEKNNDKILKKDMRKLKKTIELSIRIKADIVSRDTKEAGIRMILNYGHTYGHAIEKISKYSILHGYAVSIGMCGINSIAVENKWMKQSHAARIEALLTKAGLPTKLPKKISASSLNKCIKSDKKRVNDIQSYVIVPKIGTAAIVEM
ncbi:MAG: 3-dehydroquinate synthase [Candidatus Peregrinibacteria bacterium]|nr:3-dehydroquinate synthase [Candidatus Peregrinibacteria bacterium]MDZ4244356.1 3-dehydroquinate synthase [Candidatus Gracilibacteria bacterium]